MIKYFISLNIFYSFNILQIKINLYCLANPYGITNPARLASRVYMYTLLIDFKYDQKGGWAGMVGAVVRSLLSDHKVPSSIAAPSRFEYLCDLFST